MVMWPKMRKHQDNRGIAAGAATASQAALSNARRAAFTLAELLVVMAISIILLALLFGPMIQSFNFTRKARAVSQAQDAARFGLQRLTRELSQATFVFDNSSAYITMPLEDPSGNLPRLAAYGGRGFAYPGGSSEPTALFARIDFIPAAKQSLEAERLRRQQENRPAPVIDPTTGDPGLPEGGDTREGLDLRFPLTPGKRIVRYFVGLRYPYQIQNGQIVPDGRGVPARRWYSNVYEFPRSDQNMNPFILYRAEFNPNDPNLFDQSDQFFNSARRNDGGFNDPNFFYNVEKRAMSTSREQRRVGGSWVPWSGNGKTYGENWRDIAQPVLVGDNMDLLAWRKDTTRTYDRANPFQPTVRFSPTTIVGDAATPGFLSNAGSEAPGAVPTLYATKHGQWVLPYTITFYRGATRNDPAEPNAGMLAVTVFAQDQADGTRLKVARVSAENGRLGTNGDANWYYTFSPATGKLLVKTPSLAFQVDPNKGRIETGLPPLAGDAGGAPLYRAGNALQAMRPASLGPNEVEPLPTIFRLNTRDEWAGQAAPPGHPTTPAGQNVPTNQGILQADLYALYNGQSGDYYPADGPLGALLAPGGALPSPMRIFGQPLNNRYVGIHIAPGSEQVFGPDVTFPEQSLAGSAAVGHVSLISYTRLPYATGAIAVEQQPQLIADKSGDPTLKMYATYGTRSRNYLLDTMTTPNQAMLEFDRPGEGVAGLPARRVNDANAPEKELRVTYLWQNNFTRNASGEPVNADNQTYMDLLSDVGGSSTDVRFTPEADVVKVDYSTRSLITIALGARVYDVSSGRPTVVNVSDKVEVGNVGR